LKQASEKQMSCIKRIGNQSAVQSNGSVPSPVASAHFFHLMIKSFIKNVIGDNKENKGLSGSPAGYYAPVEQQGRLTLHLHMVL